MNLKNISNFKIFFLLYVSLLIGLFFNEDFTLGYKIDHFIHLEVINRFDNNFLYSLINFNLDNTTAHSPFFYIIFLFIKKISFNNDLIFRLINLHISLLLPYIFYLIIKIKDNIGNNKIKFLLPGLFFISPYFRSGSIWIGSENISLIFLFASFYYYLLFVHRKNKNFYLIILNIICLSIASYFRPIYCIFSIYFFLILFKELLNINKLFQYILINLILALPAFYYVFILGIDFISMHVAGGGDIKYDISLFVNQFSIIISILFYYSVPFLIFNYNEIIKNILKIKNLLLFVLYSLFLIIFFNYSTSYGGGIFYNISQFLFSNNYLFIFFSSIGLVYFKITLFDKFKNNFYDIILFFTLIFLEVDTIVFHENYDLLIYLIFYTMFTNKHFFKFISNLNSKKITFLYLFSLSYYSLTIIKNFI